MKLSISEAEENSIWSTSRKGYSTMLISKAYTEQFDTHMRGNKPTWLCNVMALGWHLVQIPSGHGACPPEHGTRTL